MEAIFYYTGLVFWAIIALGLCLSLFAYLGSALYGWYKGQESITGNNVWKL